MDFTLSLYNMLIDPMLITLRNTISHHIPSGSKVIDIACGTGTQALQLAGKCRIVTGIDINESLIRFADQKRQKQNIENLRFLKADASDLHQFSNKEFDYSILCLALHQFHQDLHKQVLQEAMRISSKLIIADYASPLPANIYGRFVKIIEYSAGGEHFRSFKKYISSGGLDKIAGEAGLRIIYLTALKKDSFRLGIFEE